MLIAPENLRLVFDGFKASFSKGLAAADPQYKSVAMVVPSFTSRETYGWLGQFPKMPEWIGDRVTRYLEARGYTVENKKSQ